MVPTAPSRRRRLPIAFIVAIVAIAVPALAFANHQFGDVPTASTYHDDVEALVGAAITTGCGGGNYCPGSAVTRGQMAAFLNRGLGIATSSYGEIPVEESGSSYIATISIPAGASTGGTGYVTVAADVTAFITGGICPCGVIIGLENLGTFDSAPVTSLVIPADSVGGAQVNTGSVDWTFEVPTGIDAEFGVWAQVFPEGPMVLGEGTEGAVSVGGLEAMMTAEYSPFGSAFSGGPKPIAGASIDTPFGPVTLGDRSE
ncbi:MAG TPA: S-layer homology domain-containing protein [Candidatus Limnocylindria bacterium]|jgi:hypothetical protein